MRQETSARSRRHRRGPAPAPPTARPPPSGGERSCASCRRPRPAAALVAWRGERRRIYACIQRPCLERLPTLGTPEALAALAAARLMQMVGLARRSGGLAAGLAAASHASRHAQARGPGAEPGAAAAADGLAPLVLVSSDVAAKRLAHLPGAITWEGGELARAAGLPGVQAVAIHPGRLASQAAYWLRLWYECAPRPGPRDKAAPISGRPNTTAFEVG